MGNDIQSPPERELHRAVFELLPEPAVIVDPARRIIDANRAARELNIDLAAVLGADADADSALLELFSSCVATGRASIELRLADRDGDARVFELEMVALGRHIHVLVLRDAGRRRELESEIAHLRRIDSLGFLTASVVHDFNNMLTPMLYLSEALTSELEPASRPWRFARDLHSAAQRATAVVRQLLAFARRGPEPASRVDVNTVVRELYPLLVRAVGQELRLTLALEESASAVRVDRDQLEQVVMNLAVNARDATPAGGSITVQIASVTLTEEQARACKCPAGGSYVAVRVSDTGAGIPRELRERVFERLFSTKASGKAAGLGIGLASAQSFAARNRGCIDVHSESGHGTTITIYLPRVSDDAPSPSRPDVGAPRGSESVLIIDDDDGVREVVRLVLEHKGYRVARAASASEALDALAAVSSGLDLLIVDVSMLHLHGRALADAVALRGEQTKVLYITGHADDVLHKYGVDASAPLLRKAFSPDELARKVREVLDG
jgi:signal transduction histidine kinase